MITTEVTYYGDGGLLLLIIHIIIHNLINESYDAYNNQRVCKKRLIRYH